VVVPPASGEPAGDRPTLLDVARAAGVSAATASRVINGFHQIRPETRRQVEGAIAELGYVRQRAARAVRPNRTGSIALVVCEEGPKLFADPFFARVLWGASRELGQAGMQVVLLMVRSAQDLRYLRGGHVDGALVVSMHGRHPIDPDKVSVPLVFCGCPVGTDSENLCYVDADNRGGAESATRHLVESGRQVIATVAGPQDMKPGVDRLDGYRAALTDAGLFDRRLVAYGDFGQSSGDHAVHLLLQRRPDVDAVFVASDLMAVGVLRALRRSGRRVPDDVAVIGFDDSPIARQTEPPLTSVRQPVEQMGSRMARELLTLLRTAQPNPRRVVLDTELIVRESA
jgi:DNA-binding LacI/PurR family transcriptional regulator